MRWRDASRVCWGAEVSTFAPYRHTSRWRRWWGTAALRERIHDFKTLTTGLPSVTHTLTLLASPSPHPSFFCSYGAMPAHSKVGILLWPCSTKHLHTLIRILICSALFLPFSFRHSGRYTRITLHRVLTLIIFSTTSVLEGSCG